MAIAGERRDIANEAKGTVADFFCRGLRPLGMARHDGDLGAGLRENPRDAFANSLRSAGNYYRPALERLCHFISPIRNGDSNAAAPACFIPLDQLSLIMWPMLL
jgi:hypothetical protein